MKFEVRYPNASPEEVELHGPVATLGRDPGCDLVLRDAKASRRHAIVEDTPEGLAIRDSASANGLYVNEKRIERAVLKNGDVVRIGDVRMKVIAEYTGTLDMERHEIEEIERGLPPALAVVDQRGPTVDAVMPPLPPEVPKPKAPPRVAPAPPPRAPLAHQSGPIRPPQPARPRTGVGPKPVIPSRMPGSEPVPAGIGLRTLSVLWALNAPLSMAAALGLAWRQGLEGLALGLLVGAGVVGGITSCVMSLGLWNRRPWARWAQIVLACVGLLFCPFSLASIAVLVYMLTPAGRAQFGDGEAPGTSQEPAFAAMLVGTVALGVLALGGMLFYFLPERAAASAAVGTAEAAAVKRLERLVAAERQYQAGTCPGAYGDLDALLKPSSAIPSYPPNGPAFLPAEFASEEAGGYRFELKTVDAVTTCPSRAFRRFTYSASPLGEGRHLVVGTDGVVRAAQGRPARPDDPAIR